MDGVPVRALNFGKCVLNQVWDVLERASFQVPETDSLLFWQTVAWPKRIADQVNEVEQKIARLKV